MWLHGMEPAEIARATGTLRHVVNRHVEYLVEMDPRLWERRLLRHDKPALPRHHAGSDGPEWGRWFKELSRFVATHGCMPRLVGPTSAPACIELALFFWTKEQRRAERLGELKPRQAKQLRAVPGWIKVHSLSGRELRWRERLAACILFVASNRRRPSYSKGENALERSLGAWIDFQMQQHRAGRLSAEHLVQLDADLASWRPASTNRDHGRRFKEPG